jgi:hypothetical protein
LPVFVFDLYDLYIEKGQAKPKQKSITASKTLNSVLLYNLRKAGMSKKCIARYLKCRFLGIPNTSFILAGIRNMPLKFKMISSNSILF